MSILGEDVLKLLMAASIGDLVVSFDILFSNSFFSLAGSSARKVLVSGSYIGSVGLSISFGIEAFGLGLVSLFSIRRASLDRLNKLPTLVHEVRALPPVLAV